MPEPKPLPDISSVDAAPLGQVGDYQLLEELGKGGMGQVYKARHAQLERIEAVKILSREHIGDEKAVARFRREMRAVASLDHPNIVRAFNALEVEGNYLLVMEYLAGLNLAQIVKRLGPLPVADASELTRQAALGLQCACENDLVHRDIKPSNLMLTPAGQVKILDLGLARFGLSGAADKSVTSTGLVMGTPDYIPPEQVKESHTVDIRADLYSLGCSLFTLLCGRPPFGDSEHETVYEKLTAHVEAAPPNPRSLRQEIPADLADIVFRMMAKKPDERFATPGEVAEELAPFAVGADTVRLLARASRAGGRGDTAGESDVDLVTPRGAETGAVASRTAKIKPPEPTVSTKRGWWKGALAGVAVLLAAIAGIWVLVARPWNDGGDSAVPAVDNEGGAQVSTSDGQSAVPPGDIGRAESSSWIVLSWAQADEPVALWLLSPDGRTRIRLTSPEGAMDTEPAFSPDGRRMAFVRSPPGISRQSDLWVCDAGGDNVRPIVVAGSESERLMSPVWLADNRLLYTRGATSAETSGTEVWQVRVSRDSTSTAEMPTPELLFRFGEDAGNAAGLVTDVAPGGDQLLAVVGRPGEWTSSDVWVTDLDGARLATVWEDEEGEYRDGRALWSPDGERIAWQRHFATRPVRIGVGLAAANADGHWRARLQPAGRVPVIMPVAWAPDGADLLCARIYGTPPDALRVALIRTGSNFELIDRMFELPGGRNLVAQRHGGRLGDWALIPPDVVLPEPSE